VAGTGWLMAAAAQHWHSYGAEDNAADCSYCFYIATEACKAMLLFWLGLPQQESLQALSCLLLRTGREKATKTVFVVCGKASIRWLQALR
jgi:hypothetical protein